MLRTDADIDNYWNYLTNLANNSGVEGAAPKFFDITEKAGLRKGMLVYEDVGGPLNAENKTIAGQDGVITENQDYVKLKKSTMTYGVNTNLSFSWRGISLLAQLSTSWGGVNKLDYLQQRTGSSQSMWAHPIYLNDMFDENDNTDGKYPNVAYYEAFKGTNSDFFLLPTFRMFVRNLSVGYTLPKEWVKKVSVENARLFVSGNNLWDFYNPYPNKYRNMYDATNVGYPTLRTWALGVNLGF
ncbi:hypothetical protein [Niabella ginsengisoli]|uniref:TonB-dependent receptor n=1 Tax=Niabella ginsengisoli TaxID=522298 RepID=A0ABS9SHZ3_9BACT|nr:hypothetical protein [Niabella ginsengisoli]MCH5597784.1 hypothetical protein [Niabella ginsengisoli]